MQTLVIEALSSKWETASGWEIWYDYVRTRLGGKQTETGAVLYRRYKNCMRQMIADGLIVAEVEHRVLAKAVWKLSDKGWTLAAGGSDSGEEAVSVTPWVKKRITAERPVTREVWKALMAAQQAGELDLVFMPRVQLDKKTGGSGR